ncbi:MAG: TrbI/VirB10 family protein [Sphingobacteriia bacterium]|nr:TrbI/VirB10 family protein [Sphingobacteriia bacterium]
MDKIRFYIVGALLSLIGIIISLKIYFNSLNTHDEQKKVIQSQKEETFKDFFTNIIPDDFYNIIKEEAPKINQIQEVELSPPNPEELLSLNEIEDESKVIEKRRAELINKRNLERARSGLNLDESNEQFILKENIQPPSILNEINEPIAASTAPIDLTRTLLAGSIIDVTLDNEIISNLPGKILGQVSNNIYASKGNKIVIPQGSKVLGKYASLNKLGDERLNIMINKIITPDGRIIKFTQETGLGDQEGKQGLAGDLDNRTVQKYQNGMLIASIAAGSQLAVPVYNEKGRAVADSFSRALVDVTAKALDETMDIKPILRIPKGSLTQLITEDNIIFPKPDEAIVLGQKLEERK